MRKRLTVVLNSSTFRQTFVTSGSTFLAAGLGAGFYLLLARTLGPTEYGLFYLAITIMSVVAFVADLGLGQTLVRFVSANRTNNKYLPYVNLALRIKLISGLLMIIIFGLFSPLLTKYVFHQPALSTLLPLVGIGILSQLLFSLPVAVFQGLQKFWIWGGFQVGTNTVRLVLILPIIFFFKLSAFQAMAIFILSYFLGVGVSWFLLDKKFLSARTTILETKSFWDFNKWTAVTGFLLALSTRVDIFLSARFLSLAQVGVYSLAAIMVSFLPQLATAIGAVTTSKFAGFTDHHTAHKYLGKAILFVGGVSVLVALTMIPVALVVIKFAGKNNYALAFTPFLILLAGQTVFLFTNPIRDSLMYYHAKPQFFFWLCLGQVVTLLLAGWILIPRFGVNGSAMSLLTGQAFTAVTSIWYYRKLFAENQR